MGKQVLKETSTQMLLAEYNRLKDLEQFRLANYEGALQLYLTVITAAVGALFFLVDTQAGLYSSRLNILLLLGSVLSMGEITFLRLMGLDIALGENAKALILIRNKFILTDPQLKNAFLTGWIQDKQKYRAWSSISGIIHRAFTRSQHKTTVVLLNCVIAAAGGILMAWPETIWSVVAVGMLSALLLGIMHALYSTWRYRLSSDMLASNEVEFWA